MRAGVLLATLAVLGMTGCEDDDNNGRTDGGTDASVLNDGGLDGDAGVDAGSEASLRVIHASPDTPAVDVYVQGDTTPVIAALPYLESSDYLSVPPGSYTLEVRAAGADPTSAPVLTVGPLTLAQGDRVSAVAAGLSASQDAADTLRVLPLPETWGAAVAGSARVRIVHAGSNAPAVKIDVGDDGASEVANLQRFADTGGEGIALPSGQALQVAVRTEADDTRVTAFTTPQLPDEANLFVIATGLLGTRNDAVDAFGLLVVGPTGVVGFLRQNPIAYALHAVPDAPAVDVFAGEAELTSELAFGDLSAPIQVPPGTATLDVFAAAAGTTRPAGAPVTTASVPLAAGAQYLVVASGLLSGTPAVTLVALEDGFGTTSSTTFRARVLHASPDAGPVSVLAPNPTSPGDFSIVPGLGAVPYLTDTPAEGLELPAIPFTLGIGAANSTTPLATFALSPAAGQSAFIVAAGLVSPEAGDEAFQLLVIDTVDASTGAQVTWEVTPVLPVGG